MSRFLQIFSKRSFNSKKILYAKWMAINSWAVSTNAVLSTNSMLGNFFKTPSYTTTITATYIGKDIIGQLGGLLYAWKTGNKSDTKPLYYITKGSTIQQAGYHLENASVFLNNNYLLPFLGFSSLLKNISFISIGAVNVHNLNTISSENIGESYSQIAAINTLSSSIGMLSGLIIIHCIPSYTIRSYLIMPILSAISLYSVRKATNIALSKNEF